jgi:hypothetical protein
MDYLVDGCARNAKRLGRSADIMVIFAEAEQNIIPD